MVAESLILMLAWAGQPPVPGAAGGPPGSQPAAAARVVKHFDFDERKLGNYESIPMHWLSHRAEGFAPFLEGRFDANVGHAAPPSFYLGVQGSSIGHRYAQLDIPVLHGSDYEVSAWVRPHRLVHARAYVGGMFVDREGQPLEATQRFSRRVGGDAEGRWRAVAVLLPPPPPDARFVRVSCWVAQPALWSQPSRAPRPIYRQDVNAGAWFDDVAVRRLPQVSLSGRAGQQVFGPDQPVQLDLSIRDSRPQGLAATLTVLDGEGRQVMRRPVPVLSARQQPELTDLGPLAPEFYEARLVVSAGGQPLLQRRLTFARLAALPPTGGAEAGSGFGVSLSGTGGPGPDAARTAVLVRRLGVRQAKVPLWRRRMSDRQVVYDDPAPDALIDALIQAGIEPVGVFCDPPWRLAARYDRTRPNLLDIFSDAPENWQPYMAFVVVRHAGSLKGWQFGADTLESWQPEPRLWPAVRSFRESLRRLVPGGEVLLPWSALAERPTERLDVDRISVTIPAALNSRSIRDQLAGRSATSQPARTYAYVESPEPVRYGPRAAAVALAKRVLMARSAAIESIFVAQPWTCRAAGDQTLVEPTDAFAVYRTLCGLLGSRRYLGEITVGPGATALIFDHAGVSVLAAWDDAAGPDGRPWRVWLGGQTVAFDLWGRRRVCRPAPDGTVELRLTRRPQLIFPVPSWAVMPQASFALSPDRIVASIRRHPASVSFINPFAQPVSGTLRLMPPPGWEVRPLRAKFTLQPGQVFEQPIEMRFPTSENAGPKVLTGRFTLDADRTYEFEAKAHFDLALKDIDVRLVSQVIDRRLIIRQTVTNRTAEAVSFRSFVLAPDRPQQQRLISELQPGRSVIKEFVFDNVGELLGRKARVGLKEVGGRRVWNGVVEVQ